MENQFNSLMQKAFRGELKMIKNIGIKNFKGISDTIEIEFKPITLLFGPNSAGKSTIIQALHYTREVFLKEKF